MAIFSSMLNLVKRSCGLRRCVANYATEASPVRRTSTCGAGYDFDLKLAREKDREEVYSVLTSSYFPDMPLYGALSISAPPSIDEWPELQTFDKNISLKAINYDGKIVGVGLNRFPTNGATEFCTKDMRQFFDYIDKDSKGLLSDCSKNLMEFSIGAVVKNWRKKGVMEKLTIGSEELAILYEQKEIFAVGTHDPSSNLFQKLDWKCVYTFYYKNYCAVDPKFKLPSNPEERLRIFVKEIVPW